jgi:hypothetical protein
VMVMSGQVLVLEPFLTEYVPGRWQASSARGAPPTWIPPHTYDRSLLGDPDVRDKAEFYKVVSRISAPLGDTTPE